MSWLPDGNHLLIVSETAEPLPNRADDQSPHGQLYLLPLRGNGKPIRLTDFGPNVNIIGATLSRDGRWLAYSTDESGRMEVYVREFRGLTGLGARWKVSTDGGGIARWRRDGSELFYVNPQGTLMAVPIRGGTSLGAGSPVPLFAGPTPYGLLTHYDVAADGQKFLVATANESALHAPMILTTNWLRH